MATTERWRNWNEFVERSNQKAVSKPFPEIGKELATRLHEHLHIETLEALASHYGRLEQLESFGRDALVEEVRRRQASLRRVDVELVGLATHRNAHTLSIAFYLYELRQVNASPTSSDNSKNN